MMLSQRTDSIHAKMCDCTCASASLQRAELYLAMLAVMKAGGCYVPVDHTLPAARVESILEQAGCRLMLTQDGVDALPALQHVQKVVLMADWKQYKQQRRSNPTKRCSVRDPAYILFTSGAQFGHAPSILCVLLC
jgi:non-ribosomal peptide synthetase component F